MALPLSRNITGSPGDPIRSADFNDIQDQIIAVHTTGRRGDRIDAIHPSDIVVAAGSSPFGASPTFGNPVNGAASDEWWIPLRYPIGTRLKNIEIDCDPGAAGAITAALLSCNGATAVNASTGSVSSSGAAIQTVSFVPTGTPTIAAQLSYGLRFTFASTGHKLLGVRVTTDVP